MRSILLTFEAIKVLYLINSNLNKLLIKYKSYLNKKNEINAFEKRVGRADNPAYQLE